MMQDKAGIRPLRINCLFPSTVHISLLKVALNRLSPAAQNNLFQPMRLMGYFRVAHNFTSVQLNLRLKSCCDSL